MPLCRVESCFKALYKQKNVIDARIYYNSIVIVDYMESEDVYEKEDNHSAVTCIFGGNQCFNGNGVQRRGVQACPGQAVLIPCFHDESYAHMKTFRTVYSEVAGMLFNAQPEQDLTEHLCDTSRMKTEVMGGIGITDTLEQILISEDGKFEKFQQIAGNLMSDSIQSIQLAPDGVVTDIYPEKGRQVKLIC